MLLCMSNRCMPLLLVACILLLVAWPWLLVACNHMIRSKMTQSSIIFSLCAVRMCIQLKRPCSRAQARTSETFTRPSHVRTFGNVLVVVHTRVRPKFPHGRIHMRVRPRHPRTYARNVHAVVYTRVRP